MKYEPQLKLLSKLQSRLRLGQADNIRDELLWTYCQIRNLAKEILYINTPLTERRKTKLIDLLLQANKLYRTI